MADMEDGDKAAGGTGIWEKFKWFTSMRASLDGESQGEDVEETADEPRPQRRKTVGVPEETFEDVDGFFQLDEEKVDEGDESELEEEVVASGAIASPGTIMTDEALDAVEKMWSGKNADNEKDVMQAVSKVIASEVVRSRLRGSVA